MPVEESLMWIHSLFVLYSDRCAVGKHCWVSTVEPSWHQIKRWAGLKHIFKWDDKICRSTDLVFLNSLFSLPVGLWVLCTADHMFETVCINVSAKFGISSAENCGPLPVLKISGTPSHPNMDFRWTVISGNFMWWRLAISTVHYLQVHFPFDCKQVCPHLGLSSRFVGSNGSFWLTHVLHAFSYPSCSLLRTLFLKAAGMTNYALFN